VSWNGVVGAAQASCASFVVQLLATALILYRALASRSVQPAS